MAEQIVANLTKKSDDVIKTDDEVYEVVGTGPKWLIMFYNSLKEVYESYKQ